MKLSKLALTLSLLCAVQAEAAKLRVPEDYANIQAALDAALNGDVVQISAGTYDGGLLLQSRTNVRIVGRGKVVIRALGPIGLEIKNCTGITVEKIRFRDASFHNLYVEGCDDVTVRKCRVNNGWNAFYFKNCLGVLIRGCRAQDVMANGISLDLVDGSLVENNTLRRIGSIAVLVIGDGNTVVDNVIQDVNDIGCVVSNSQGGVVAGNRIRGVADRAVWLSNSTSVGVFDNVIQDASVGVKVSSSYHTIVGNKIQKMKLLGISVFAANHLLIRGNKIVRALHDGIRFTASDSICQGNTVRKSGHTGLYIVAQNCSFVGNVVKQSAFRGGAWVDIEEAAGSSGNVYTGNVYGTSNF